MAASLTCAPFAQAVTGNGYGLNPTGEIGENTVPSTANGDQAYDLTGGKISAGNGTYYITGGCGGSGTASIDYLDVSGVSAIGTTGYNWGTKINESPNPFAWNDALGVFEFTNLNNKSDYTSTSYGIGFNKTAWTGVLTYATVNTYRPDILAGSTSAQGVNGLEQYETMVSMINQADANSSYDPQIINFSQHDGGLGLTTLSDFLWATASAVEKVQAADSTKVTRYEDSAREIAQKFEGFLKGIQWYILSEVEGTSKMKTVAFVTGSSDGTITATMTNPSEETDVAVNSTVRKIEGIEQTTKNATIVNDGWTRQGEETNSLYTYTTTDLASAFKDVDIVFYLASSGNQGGGGGQGGGNSGSTATNQTVDEFETSLEAAGIKADVVAPEVAISNQGFGLARNYVELISYVYPEYFKLSYGLKYFWENFAHVKSEYVEAVMQDQDGSKLLPTGDATTDLDTTGYSESYINEKIAQGETYYQANYQNENSNCSNFRLRATGTVPENEYQFGTFDTPTIKSQSIKVAKKTVKVKRGKSTTVKVSGAKTALVVSSSNKKVTAKAIGKKKVKITVKKSAKKGSYKVKVYAKKSSSYKKSATKTITVKVK